MSASVILAALLVVTNSGNVSLSPGLTDAECAAAVSQLKWGESEAAHQAEEAKEKATYDACRTLHPVPPAPAGHLGALVYSSSSDPCLPRGENEAFQGWIEFGRGYPVDPGAVKSATCVPPAQEPRP